MKPTVVDIQAGLLLCAFLVGLLVFVGNSIIKTSSRKILSKLLGAQFTLGNVSFTLKELISKDDDKVLPLYYRWFPFFRLTLFSLPGISFFSLAYCAYYLTLNLSDSHIPKTDFVHALIFSFCSVFIQVVMVLYIEKFKINIEGQ